MSGTECAPLPPEIWETRPMAAVAAAKNLLFGLLALQNGLVSQVQLVAAFQAWTLDKARTLAGNLALMRKDDSLGFLRSRPDFRLLMMDLEFSEDPFAR